MYSIIKGPFWVFIVLTASLSLTDAYRDERRCPAMDIRNYPYVINTDYLNCTIVEGDFTMALMTDDMLTEDMFPVFHSLREITGAILIFNIKSLTSLGRIFPNLRVIGGYSLIMNYALVIYQNNDLRDIGLTKLSLIKNGGVRIAENKQLCYMRNIQWKNMIVGNLKDVILETPDSHCEDRCVVADKSKCYQPYPNVISCWNSMECQSFCPHYKYEDGSFGPGCTDTGEICHEYCLGGCTTPNDPWACHTCKYVEIHGMCADKCPENMYEYSSRRCVTEEQCEQIKPEYVGGEKDQTVLKAFRGKCSADCPPGYEEDPNNRKTCKECHGHCPKKCHGDENIDSIGAALKYKGCNIVDGFLEIEIRIGNEANAEKFSEAFGELEEINGYLSIRFSTVFVTLHMFKKLRVIHGNKLYRDAYALVIFDNQNLRELFNIKRQSLSIRNGKVDILNNRNLCSNKIVEFLKHINRTDDITTADLTQSNGDKAVCEEVPLEVKVVQVYSAGFTIRWVPFNTTDMDHRKFIGYQVYYKKVDKIDKELSIDEDRSACADSWKMHFSDATDSIVSDGDAEEVNKSQAGGTGHIISLGIEPNSIYAFYVQTRIVSHPGARNAISKVHFVKTLFGPPDSPQIRLSKARGPDRVEIQWDEPLNPNGVITHYSIEWSVQDYKDYLAEELNGCDDVNKPAADVLISKKTKKPGTCSAQEGCCDCSSVNDTDMKSKDSGNDPSMLMDEMELQREERDAFENAVQNRVFVRKCDFDRYAPHCLESSEPTTDPPWPPVHQKRRRHVNVETRSVKRVSSPYRFTSWLNSDSNETVVREKRQAKMDSSIVTNILERTETAFNISVLNVSADGFPPEFQRRGKINITGNRILITGLPHFVEYKFLIAACQDVNATENFCSPTHTWVPIRTAALRENDQVPPESIHVLNVTNGKENDLRVNWSPPKNPNGMVLAYRVKLRSGSNATPLYKCVNRTQFINDEGVTFMGLSGGTYSIEIRTMTLAGLSDPTIVKDIFSIYDPIITKKGLIVISIIFLLCALIAGVIAYFGMKYYNQKKEEEKANQFISLNPEYLSQIDVYKKDEWELPRNGLVLGKEIGAGTFGKVHRGLGRDLVSVNGDKFGECAIKTISKKDANMDRYHFLIEASVMKQFNTNFIVKLYGVVSDEPVYVVMELMEKGNLRDFLRAHRPGSEENASTRYTLPTPNQYYLWAAQIADGMAYLENLRFCHRDLAARNCMVHSDETVKIGDFGMARDIYYQEYYKPQGRRLMPIRWLSPESLKDGKFTLKSDVWAFGIVLYEMLTLGQQPYAGLGNNQVFKYICVQKRVIARPRNCPDIWYNMMRACWMFEPRERPCFWQIVDYLKSQTDKKFQGLSFVYNDQTLDRTEGDYFFEQDWPVEGDFDNHSDHNEDENGKEEQTEVEAYHKDAHEDVKNQSDNESGLEDSYEHDDSNTCSCSECSNDRDVLGNETFLEPMQRRNIRDYFNSIVSPEGHNDMTYGKSNERDMECLLSNENQTDDDEYVVGNQHGLTQSFGNESSASTSRVGRHKSEPKIEKVNETKWSKDISEDYLMSDQAKDT